MGGEDIIQNVKSLQFRNYAKENITIFIEFKICEHVFSFLFLKKYATSQNYFRNTFRFLSVEFHNVFSFVDEFQRSYQQFRCSVLNIFYNNISGKKNGQKKSIFYLRKEYFPKIRHLSINVNNFGGVKVAHGGVSYIIHVLRREFLTWPSVEGSYSNPLRK